VGGLGSAISDYKSQLGSEIPHLTIGLPDKFGKTAEYQHLLKIHKLKSKDISNTILKKIKKLS